MNAVPDGSTGAEPGFVRRLLSAFRYPLSGGGGFIITGGAVFFTVAEFIFAHVSFIGMVLQVGVLGYLAAFAKDVVRTSALGEQTPPGWTDFSDWPEDLVRPAAQFWVVMGLVLGPLIFLHFKHPLPGGTGRAALVIAGLWGVFAGPILFMAVAMTDSVAAAFNPVPLVRAAMLIFPYYLLTCGFFVGLAGAGVAVGASMARVGWIPILPGLVGWWLALYLMTVILRGFGLLYRCHHDELQWY